MLKAFYEVGQRIGLQKGDRDACLRCEFSRNLQERGLVLIECLRYDYCPENVCEAPLPNALVLGIFREGTELRDRGIE